MFVIGLAGGIASGKSFVACCFAELGCEILNADQVGHQVLSDPCVVQQIRQRWGEEIIEGSEVNRSKLASIVFPAGVDFATDDLRHLESITHPKIGERIFLKLNEIRQSRSTPAVVLDAPVMFKANWDQFCSRIVFVDAALEVRQKRAVQRGWAVGELERRERQQVSIEEKKRRSTDVIDNSSTEDNTVDQVRRLWIQWKPLMANQQQLI